MSRIEARDGKVVARRIVEDGYELVEAPMPLVASILSDDTNVPRYSKLKDIMAAARKTVPVWKAADLGVEPARVGPGGPTAGGAGRERSCSATRAASW